MGKNDRTIKGRAPNAGRNLHEQPTLILDGRAGRDAAKTTTSKPPCRRESPGDVADALAEFRKTEAAKKFRGEPGVPSKKR